MLPITVLKICVYGVCVRVIFFIITWQPLAKPLEI